MPAYQSSTRFSLKVNGAGNAVDGNNDGIHEHASCTHTNDGDKAPWWMVDLKDVILVIHIDIYNRVDCCGMCISSKKPQHLMVFNFVDIIMLDTIPGL